MVSMAPRDRLAGTVATRFAVMTHGMTAVCGWVAFAVLAGGLAGQQPRPERSMLPDEALAAVEVADPPAAVAALLSALGNVPEGLPMAVRGQVAVGAAAVVVALGGTPQRWAERVAGGGAVVGLLPHEGKAVAVAITQPDDMDGAIKWFSRVLGAERHAVVGKHLLLAGAATALPKLRKHVEQSDGKWGNVALSNCSDGGSTDIRILVDLQSWRELSGDKWPSAAKLDGVGRFFLAPVAHVLAEARWLRIAIGGGDRLLVEVEADASARGRDDGQMLLAKPRPLPVLPPDGVAALRLERSLHRLFATPETFLDEDERLAIGEFLSIADALDGPHTSFVDDGLGGLGEPLDLLVFASAADEGSDDRAPASLPQFAFVTEVTGKPTEALMKRMLRLFATIVNTERMQMGKQAFLVRNRRGDDGGHGIVSEPRNWQGPGLPPIEQQVTPTIWFDDGFVALASTHAAAIAAIVAAQEAQPAPTRGDRLLVRGGPLARELIVSHRQLAFARMLDEGDSPARADQFFVVLEHIATAIDAFEITLVAEAKVTRATVRLQRAPAVAKNHPREELR